jgi:tRNA-Thr(GGU) m(6)t(6)A37 methyltransferase TsaA
MKTAKTLRYTQIGIIHTPFTTPEGTPIQPMAAQGAEGRVEVFQTYCDGLKDLDGFTHIYLIYNFHLVNKSTLQVKPFLDDEKRGIFSTRAPIRPNPIGMSVVELLQIEKNMLYIKDLDIVDGTPLLDIKPYVPDFDHREAGKIGWLQKHTKRLPGSKDDGRFV